MLTRSTINAQPMRIAGRKVSASDVIEVRYPYTGEVIGTVPAGTVAHAREAFDIAANYQSAPTGCPARACASAIRATSSRPI